MKSAWLNQTILGQLGVGLALLLIALLSVALHTSSQRANEAISWTEHTQDSLIALSRVREALAVAESSHRGWLIDQDSAYQKRLDQSLAELEDGATRVAQLLDDEPLQLLQAQRLAGLIANRIELFAPAIEANAGDISAARAFFRSGQPQQASDAVLALVDQLAAEENQILAQRLRQQRESGAQMRAVLIATGVAAIGLLLPLCVGFLMQSRALLGARVRLAGITESLPGAVYVYRVQPDGNARFEFISGNIDQVRGVAREAALRDPALVGEVIEAEDRERYGQALAASRAALSDLEVDYRILRNGEIRWLRDCAIPTRVADGSVLWNGYWSDVTRLKRTEHALQEARQRLEDAQRTARIGDWTHDLATGSLTWSPFLYELLHRDPALGPPGYDEAVTLFEDGSVDVITRSIGNVLQSGQPVQYELRVRPGEGRPLHVLVTAVPCREADGQITSLRGTLQDVSALKELEIRLREAKENADSANRAKSTFLATMSHEIRTPMNGILGTLELISLAPLSPEVRSSLAVARESGASLQRIIDDILDFSKIEAGKLEIRAEPTSIADIIVGVQRIFSGTASSLGLAITLQCDPMISPAALLDGLRLRQILSNLVSNSLKFTREGEVRIRAEHFEPPGGSQWVKFTVEDTGIGIPREAQSQLFQAFNQAEGASAARFGGTGLGLAISRRLAELMGGGIELHSEPGAGTRVTVIIPAPVADPQTLPDSSGGRDAAGAVLKLAAPSRPAPTVEQAEREGTLILVVDDHPTNLLVMRGQLRVLGYASIEAEGAEQALELLEHRKVGLVLTDCNMPVVSGYELSRRIRERERQAGSSRVPIVACSANALDGVVQDCLAAGMDDYIVKPTGLRLMQERLRRWLPLPEDDLESDASTSEPAQSEPPPTAPARVEPAPALDPRVLHGLTKGDLAATSRVLAQFRRVNDADVAALMQAIKLGEVDQVVHYAHRIKGAAGLVGATPMASVCAEIEQAGRRGDKAAVNDQSSQLQHYQERLNEYFNAAERN